MDLTTNAKFLLEQRYLRKDAQGKVVETPEQMFLRVAKDIAKADLNYEKQKLKASVTEKKFFRLISELNFLPNSPVLMNAGTNLPQLSACFVLPIEDSLDSIFNTLHKTALIHKSGGGTGFDFSSLRSKDDYIMETGGKSSGPVSFIQIFDCATEQIKLGGRRRGANMAILRIDHPDIEDFIEAKLNSPFRNFNFSVAITDRFMSAYKNNRMFTLVDKVSGKKIKKDPKKIFNMLCRTAWKIGDPGVIFIDRINRAHIFDEKIVATNPCGEQPLLPHEACFLGSVNLAKHYNDDKIDWEKLRQTVHTSVHFLDNCIDRSNLVFEEIEKKTKANRKIGLGVMGFADLLFALKISYNSDQAVKLALKIMKFIKAESYIASEELAKIRGVFPNYRKNKLKIKRRNATLTTIAPTGSISLIAGCSSGIEPLFALAMTQRILNKNRVSEVNPILNNYINENNINKEIVKLIKDNGKVPLNVPKEMKDVFVTALDVQVDYHLKVQAAFQKYTDNAVSKTVNLKNTATISDVRKIYLKAYQYGAKGVTVYRSGSKEDEILSEGIGKKCKECLL